MATTKRREKCLAHNAIINNATKRSLAKKRKEKKMIKDQKAEKLVFSSKKIYLSGEDDGRKVKARFSECKKYRNYLGNF